LPRHAFRPLLAAILTVTSLATILAAPATAFEPPRPLPGYGPAFVSEIQPGKWLDCTWASAAMLVDKWTNGRVTPSREALRALSGDHAGGSTLVDIARAFRAIGMPLRYSPDGGDPMTWPGLLDRLAYGAGAILLGSDTRLPRFYGRWDLRFWQGKGKTDAHAVYVERFEPRTGRIWLMDPLAPSGWTGEWISAASLYRFAWKSGGLVSAATTPTALPAPFAGVRLGAPVLATDATTLRATWPVRATRAWRFQGADVRATFQRVTDPIAAAVAGLVASAPGPAAAHRAVATASYAAHGLTAGVPMPATPGAYRAVVRVVDRRFGRVVATAIGAGVFVPGPRSAGLMLLPISDVLRPGAVASVSFTITNSGTTSWADDPRIERLPNGSQWRRATRVTATWVPVRLDAPTTGVKTPAAGGAGGARGAGGGATLSGTIPPVAVLDVPLDPGAQVVATVSVQLPAAAGSWALVLDVADDIDGSFAALGSVPAVTMVEVHNTGPAQTAR